MSGLRALLLLCAVACASAATKSFLADYKSAGGVDKYVNFAKEICQIADAAAGGDFQAALNIYQKDTNKKSAVYSTSLKAFATTDFSSQRYFGLATKYWDNKATWLDDYMMSALDGSGLFSGGTRDMQEEGIEKTAQSGIAVQLILKELDTASENMAAKKYGDKDGAPHALDEAWAVYATQPTCGPAVLGEKYAYKFATIVDCVYNQSLATKKIATGFVNARAAAKSGQSDAFNSARDAIIAGMLEVHIQATLNYAAEMAVKTGDAAKTAQAEGYTFYRTIAPFVAQADAKVDDTITKVMKIGNAIDKEAYTTVKAAFEKVYGDLNVETANIGTYNQAATLTCPAAKAAAGSTAAKAVAVVGGLAAAAVALL